MALDTWVGAALVTEEAETLKIEVAHLEVSKELLKTAAAHIVDEPS